MCPYKFSVQSLCHKTLADTMLFNRLKNEGLRIAGAAFFLVVNIVHFASFEAVLQKMDTKPVTGVFI